MVNLDGYAKILCENKNRKSAVVKKLLLKQNHMSNNGHFLSTLGSIENCPSMGSTSHWFPELILIFHVVLDVVYKVAFKIYHSIDLYQTWNSKSFKWTTRLNRVKEKNKRQQTSKDKIEDDSTEFTKTLKDRTSNSPEVQKSDGGPSIRLIQAEKQDVNRTFNSGMNDTNDGAPKYDDQEKNVASTNTHGYYSTANEWKSTKKHLRNA